MIRIVDLMFYKIFRLLIRLKKDESGAKYSALLYIGIYSTAFFISLACILGFLIDIPASSLKKNNFLVFLFIIDISSTLLFGWHFYRNITIHEIEIKYNSMSGFNRKLTNIFIYFALITIPISSFVLFRFYVFGHI